MRYNIDIVIDLSERIIQTNQNPLKAPNGNLKWHPLRRALQVVCGIFLVALPLTNGMRLDVRRAEFYFAWHRMAAHDMFLLFWVSMVGVAAVAAISLFYGRLWCGSICPQTLASDFADSLKARLGKTVRRHFTGPNRVRIFGQMPASSIARLIWTVLIVAMSIATGGILACYWFAPHDVAWAFGHPLRDIPISLTIYGIAAALGADMLWVRRRFCSDVCPYGPLMGVLADQNTLTVRYLDEREDDCIRCGKCVTDCPMGIDIKQGIMQLDCIGCGECVDSCNDVLGKIGKPGLIELRYGTAPERITANLPLWQRLGFWDGKRIGAVALLLISSGIVLWTMFGRMPLNLNVIANGAITRNAQFVRNTYSVTITNGTPNDATYVISSVGLAQANIEPTSSIRIQAHDTQTVPITVAVPAASVQLNSRTPIQITVLGGGQKATADTIFYTPTSQASKKE